MKNLHTNSILWNKLNRRTFQTLFNEFSDLYNILLNLNEKRETSLYLRIYNLFIYALFDLIYYCGYNYIISEYGEDFSDTEKFIFLPDYNVIYSPLCEKYLTFAEWETFCKEFLQRSYIYGYDKKDYSDVELKVAILAFFEIPLPIKE